MPLTKNQIISLPIESLSSDGSGVGRYAGQAVFVPGAAPGDQLRVRIVKPMKTYAFGRVEQVLAPGPGRVAPDCAVYAPCGGCSLRHLSYAAECEAKTGFVRDAFRRIGGLEVPVEAVVPSPQPERYRNKVQLPVGRDAQGRIITGFYAGRTHRIVACGDCKLQPEWMNALAQAACRAMERHNISPYDEETAAGSIRHLYLRQGWHSGQRLLCFVVNGTSFAHQKEICAELQEQFSLTTVLLNTNTARTNVILGPDTRVLYGPGVIQDTLAGVPLAMGVHEFYQINTPAAELLYGIVNRFSDLRPDDFLLDLYCGMGTIGLSLWLANAKTLSEKARLVGVESVPQAVEEAKATAARVGAKNTAFFCLDAAQAASRFAAEGRRPNVVVLDPPRKGCGEATLTAVAEMVPRTIVMVSCNAATAARDVRWLCEHGYAAQDIQPVDLFPRTRHVETVVQLVLRKSPVHVNIDVDVEELVQDKRGQATYPQIKEYVLEHSGLKVSSLYIAQVKQKCGIIERKNYNKPKSEDSRQPICPSEKEAAIKEALEYFGMN
jgi:23S rRNA (uracil1939-C5)-methyltransferase